ncbi:MAG: fumarylacetoacetate hydrolase family protein [Deltaproteobacteria bacterium]|nr:fumarylacetoacetate hydrolase family protein [Deltaproteobacteria bacterium]
MTRLARAVDAQGRYFLAEVLGLDADGLPGPSAALQPLVGDMFGERRPAGLPVPLATATLLPPVVPSKVIGIGSNYRDHAAEMGKPVPEVPKVFLKPSTAIIGPGLPIELPPGTNRVDHEAELAIVIGRRLSRATPDEARAGVLGWTCGNDVTARDLQKIDGVFARAKGFDSFCPLGPFLCLGAPPAELKVRCHVNGVARQDSDTRQMVFDWLALVVFVSDIMTLLPGDVILTGTPAGVGPLNAGDTVEVFVQGAGLLRNPVILRSDRAAAAR